MELEPPWPLLQGTLAARHGIAIASSEAKQAMLVEMAYYRAHHRDGGRRELTRRPAQALCARAEGPVAAGRISERRGDDGGAARLTALHSFSDAAPALAGLRAAGLRLAVVSNWDCSLRSVLAELGLAGAVDAIVVSAEVGALWLDAAIFLAALEQLRREPHEAVFVGDSLETDVLESSRRRSARPPARTWRRRVGVRRRGAGLLASRGRRAGGGASVQLGGVRSDTPANLKPPPGIPESAAQPLPDAVTRLPWPASAGVAGLLFGMLVTIVLIMLIGGFYVAAGFDDPADAASFDFVAIAAQSLALVAVTLAITSRIRRPSAMDFGFRRPTGPRRVFFGYLAVAYAYSLLANPKEDDLPQQLGADESTSLAIITGIFVIAVAPPLVEEFFFRGFLYQAFRNRIGVWAAAVASGLIFGAIHSAGVPDPVGIVEFLLAWLFQKTGSLWPCIAVHATATRSPSRSCLTA